MDTYKIDIEDIYIPVKRKRDIDPDKVDEIAESMMEDGQKVPIMVRDDGKRLVLVEGLQRLEAARALGEETIQALKVSARQR
jgi:ParB-like chromosome segregation protein Spo0J